MNMRFSMIAAVVGGFAATGAQAELVFNGGFETGDMSGWIGVPPADGSDYGVINQGRTDSYSLKLSADGGVGDFVGQHLTLVPGQTYAVEFWVMNYGVGEDGLRVTWQGQTLEDFGSPIGFPLESWTLVSLEAVATNDVDTMIGFIGYDGVASILIDDISVRPVPAPAGFTMACIAGLAAARRRRVG